MSSKYNHKTTQKIPEDIIHKVLEDIWGITKPRRHYQIFIIPCVGIKVCLPFIPLSDPDNVIHIPEINLGEYTCFFRLVK